MPLETSQRARTHGLPVELLNIYFQYKENTDGLLSWIRQEFPAPQQSIQRLTVDGLALLAKDVFKKIFSVPNFVHVYFREAIAGRKTITEYYRAQGEDTASHEYFTAT